MTIPGTVRVASADGLSFQDFPVSFSSYACKVGDDVSAYLKSLAPGASASIQPGTYPVRAGITGIAANLNLNCPGAVLDGSVTLTGWTATTGGLWYIDGKLPSGTADTANGGGVQPEYNAGHAGVWNDPRWNDNCLKREDVYLADDPANPVRLTRVMAQQYVASGSFFADYTANRIWVADNPAMHPVKMCLTPYAIQTNASPVITQMEFAYFATPAQKGAVWMTGGSPQLIDCKSRWNHAANVYLAGCTAPIVLRGDYRFAGQTGIAAYNNTGGSISGLPNCSSFNTSGFRVLDGENGGVKASANNGFSIEVYAHNGNGLGVWLDVTNHNVTIQNCDLQGNGADGIRDEIGFGSIIRNNLIVGNCLQQLTAYGANNGSPFESAELHVANSSGVTVTGNTVVATLNGIFFDCRVRAVNGVATTTSGTATGNDITLTGKTPVMGIAGAGALSGASGQLSAITFDGNTYRLDATGAARMRSNTSNLTFAQWQAAGFDKNGKVVAA